MGQSKDIVFCKVEASVGSGFVPVHATRPFVFGQLDIGVVRRRSLEKILSTKSKKNAKVDRFVHTIRKKKGIYARYSS